MTWLPWALVGVLVVALGVVGWLAWYVLSGIDPRGGMR